MVEYPRMVKAKRPPKTIKEKKFVKEYLKTGNATEAAMKAYDVSSYKSANTLGTQTLVKLSIVDIMEKNGLTDEKITKTLNEAMEANKPISAVGGKDASEASMDFIDVPDWQARLKATELASKIKGHLKEKMDVTTNGKDISTISMSDFIVLVQNKNDSTGAITDTPTEPDKLD